MNTLTNALLFCASIALLALGFVAVNVYMKRLSLKDLGEMMSPSAVVARFQDRANQAQNGANKSADFGDSMRGANLGRDSSGGASLWSTIFARKELPSYRYPVPELSIAVDFSPKRYTDILQISNLDSYKFFCLKEILKSHNVRFAYHIHNQKAKLEIALDSNAMRTNLLNELKRYNIAYNIIKGG